MVRDVSNDKNFMCLNDAHRVKIDYCLHRNTVYDILLVTLTNLTSMHPVHPSMHHPSIPTSTHIALISVTGEYSEIRLLKLTCAELGNPESGPRKQM